MNGEKTKSPGKEFSAQVSDYVPKRKNRSWSAQLDVEALNGPQPQEIETNAPESETLKKQKRPWQYSSFSSEKSHSTVSLSDETGHKVDTKRLQTGHKPRTKLSTNRTQSGHKKKGGDQSKLQTGHKVDTQLDTVSDTKWTRTAHKPDTKLGFTHLVGLQRKVLLFIYRACQSARGRMTEALSLEHIAQSLGIRVGSVKTTVRRLEKKECLFRKEFKNGRGGWSKYEISDLTFAALLQLETEHKLDTNWVQSAHKADTQLDTQPDTSSSSSSSSLKSIRINEELLTTGEPIVADELGAAWQKIDYSLLTEIRFGRHQIMQIAREGKFTPDELQDSIYAFAFDLLENGKTKTITGVPLNYFMGILRRGPYAAPSNYESPDVRQKRLYLESKEQQRKKRHELDERLETVEFDEWLEKLSLEQRATIVPPKDFAKPGGTAHNYQMREYFRENVWPDVRNRITHESQLHLSHEGIEDQ